MSKKFDIVLSEDGVDNDAVIVRATDRIADKIYQVSRAPKSRVVVTGVLHLADRYCEVKWVIEAKVYNVDDLQPLKVTYVEYSPGMFIISLFSKRYNTDGFYDFEYIND